MINQKYANTTKILYQNYKLIEIFIYSIEKDITGRWKVITERQNMITGRRGVITGRQKDLTGRRNIITGQRFIIMERRFVITKRQNRITKRHLEFENPRFLMKTRQKGRAGHELHELTRIMWCRRRRIWWRPTGFHSRPMPRRSPSSNPMPIHSASGFIARRSREWHSMNKYCGLTLMDIGRFGYGEFFRLHFYWPGT